MESKIKLLVQFTRKHHYIDFFTQDLEALAELEGIHDIIDKTITNEFLAENPYAYINVPSLECAQRIMSRCVLIKSLNLVFGEGTTLEEARKNINQELIAKFLAEHAGSIAFRIEARNQTTTGKTYIEHINNIVKDCNMADRKVDLHHPDIAFKLIEVYKFQDNTSGVLKSYFAVELMVNPNIFNQFSLPQRAYLGPTTTDNELAFLMANQALVSKKSLVYDPFCGTCGILLICSHLGYFLYVCEF